MLAQRCEIRSNRLSDPTRWKLAKTWTPKRTEIQESRRGRGRQDENKYTKINRRKCPRSKNKISYNLVQSTKARQGVSVDGGDHAGLLTRLCTRPASTSAQ